jgi:DNA polymerase-3 subunit alpha
VTGTTANVVKYINECREMGIRVLPPDVNRSAFNFTPDLAANEGKGGIRFGLGAVKNVGQGAVEAIVASHKEGGDFKSIYDFCERIDMAAVNRRVIESFIKAGAMDLLDGTRAQMFAVLDSAIETGQRAWRDRASGQSGLFAAMFEEQPPEDHPLPDVPDWTGQEKLTGEKEVLGFYVTGHPLDQYRDKVSELADHTTDSLEGLDKNTAVTLCGILTAVQRKRTKDGKPWAAMQLEDLAGSVDALVFSTQYDRLLEFLQEDRAVMVRALVLPEDSAPPKISIQDIIPLALASVNLPSLISIRVPLGTNGNGEKASALTDLFARKPGETGVRLRLEKPRDFSVILDLPGKVRPDKEFRSEVARICGAEALEILAT